MRLRETVIAALSPSSLLIRSLAASEPISIAGGRRLVNPMSRASIEFIKADDLVVDTRTKAKFFTCLHHSDSRLVIACDDATTA